MTRRGILPLALALATGCTGGSSPPKPALSSVDRSERLEAVRIAQEKYGARPQPVPDAAAGRAAPASDAEAIVGRWEHPWTAGCYFRFHADGTFRRVALLDSVGGTYFVLSPGVIALDYPGVLYGRNMVELKYRLHGDTLELNVSLGWVAYTKAK